MTVTLERINLNTFMTGLIAGLAHTGIQSIRQTQTDTCKAIIKAAETFTEEATQAGHKIMFSLHLHKIHQDCPEITTALNVAAASDLIRLDTPEPYDIQINIYGKEEANLYLNRLEGTPEMYLNAANTFTDTLHTGT